MMPREEYVLIIGPDGRDGSAAADKKKLSRAAVVAGVLGLMMCLAVASFAFREHAAALLGINGSDDGQDLATAFLLAAPTATVQQLGAQLEAWMDAPQNTHFQSLSLNKQQFASLADSAQLCAKKDVIAAKLDELLSKLINEGKDLNTTLAASQKAYDDANAAWLDCEASYRLAADKKKDAEDGAAFARDKFEKWGDAVKAAYTRVADEQKQYNEDYADVLAERSLIVTIMSTIGLLQEPSAEAKAEHASAPAATQPANVDASSLDLPAVKVSAIVNGIPYAADNAPFPIPARILAVVIPSEYNKQATLAAPQPLPELNFNLGSWANSAQKGQELTATVKEAYAKSANMGARFQQKVQKLSTTLAEADETQDVKIILNQMLEELRDRAQAITTNYQKAQDELQFHVDKQKKYELDVVNLSNEADKAAADYAKSGIERQKLSAGQISAKEDWEDESAKVAALLPTNQKQIAVVSLIKGKISDFCKAAPAPAAAATARAVPAATKRA